MGRSIVTAPDQAPADSVREWLCGKTKSARLIAQRPVVVIHPAAERGSVLWDPPG